MVKPHEVLKTTFFSCDSSTNEHYVELYARVDFARLLVIERELRIKGSRFAIYVDADISLETGITDVCKGTSQDVLLWYIPNIPKNGYFIENQMMGFKPNALPDLDRVITTTAHVVINDKQNGYSALRTYSEEVGKEFLKIYASEPPPDRITNIKDAIDWTFLEQNGIKPRQCIHVSITPALEKKTRKQTDSAENNICSSTTKDDSKAAPEKSTDLSQTNVSSNGNIDSKKQTELKSQLNKLKKPDDSGPNNGSCNIM
ncbi:MAG: hypothetical protein Q8R24_10235 [Legionellaceae bacterium]|nr:hypothetical protein [Legionellaceae bacterium]